MSLANLLQYRLCYPPHRRLEQFPHPRGGVAILERPIGSLSPAKSPAKWKGHAITLELGWEQFSEDMTSYALEKWEVLIGKSSVIMVNTRLTMGS